MSPLQGDEKALSAAPHKMPIIMKFGITLLVVPVILLVLAINPAIGGHYRSPASSMMPTINIGDHFYVSKSSYAFSDTKVPLRGDVVAFKSPKIKTTMVKRVIGLPNDIVQVTRGRLVINGKIIRRKHKEKLNYPGSSNQVIGVDKYQEFLPGNDREYYILEQTDQGPLDNTKEFVVPDGHIFVLGDNRDNSSDSRYHSGPGFVPVENIIGEATHILFQSNNCAVEEGIQCPPKRFFEKL